MLLRASRLRRLTLQMPISPLHKKLFSLGG
jgi:hypothetical protein